MPICFNWRVLVLVSALIVGSLKGSSASEQREKPFDEGNFKKVVLATNLTEPMNLSVAADGRVYLVERLGVLKVWTPATGAMKTITSIKTFQGSENSLLGIALDPGFLKNHWVYL